MVVSKKMYNFALSMVKHLIYIGMGSNVQSGERVLQWTRRKLRIMFGSTVHFSAPVLTDPIDFPYPTKFLNQIGAIITERPQLVVESLLKDLEQQMGRKKSAVARGIVVLDLDLLSFDRNIVRPADWERPYVKDGVAELQNWVHVVLSH